MELNNKYSCPDSSTYCICEIHLLCYMCQYFGLFFITLYHAASQMCEKIHMYIWYVCMCGGVCVCVHTSAMMQAYLDDMCSNVCTSYICICEWAYTGVFVCVHVFVCASHPPHTHTSIICMALDTAWQDLRVDTSPHSQGYTSSWENGRGARRRAAVCVPDLCLSFLGPCAS